MAVEITGEYLGNLGVAVEHGPSGKVLETAAPVDNNGDGSSFSPTDLVAAALGSCMLTIVGIVAQREGIELEGLRFEANKYMRSDPRRIDRIPIRIYFPAGLDAGQRKTLEEAALGCPVCRSLLDAVERPVEFVTEDQSLAAEPPASLSSVHSSSNP